MAGHAPGPWEAKYLPQHRMRVVKDESTSICDIALWTTDYDEQMANARLIAAAPDLLEALQLVASHIQSLPRSATADTIHASATAAIEKATGNA